MLRRSRRYLLDKLYYATRPYIIDASRLRQNLVLLISAAIALLIAFVLFLSGLAQTALAKNALTDGSAIVLFLLTVLILTFLLPQLGAILFQQPPTTAYIENCADIILERSTTRMISKQSRRWRKTMQVLPK